MAPLVQEDNVLIFELIDLLKSMMIEDVVVFM